MNWKHIFLQADLAKAADKAIRTVMQQHGAALPCHVTAVDGQFVTVAFDLPQGAPWVLPEITIPKAEGPWINSPTQVGDPGMTVAAQAYLHPITGQYKGNPAWRIPGNLDALVWIPVANVGNKIPNQNAALVQGPDGAIIQTTQGTASSVVTNQSGTTVTFGSNTLVVNGSQIAGTVGSTSLTITDSEISMTAGGQTVVLNSDGFSIGGILFDAHEHSGVATGSDNTGGVVT